MESLENVDWERVQRGRRSMAWKDWSIGVMQE
jgi:hypothetical protein